MIGTVPSTPTHDPSPSHGTDGHRVGPGQARMGLGGRRRAGACRAKACQWQCTGWWELPGPTGCNKLQGLVGGRNILQGHTMIGRPWGPAADFIVTVTGPHWAARAARTTRAFKFESLAGQQRALRSTMMAPSAGRPPEPSDRLSASGSGRRSARPCARALVLSEWEAGVAIGPANDRPALGAGGRLHCRRHWATGPLAGGGPGRPHHSRIQVRVRPAGSTPVHCPRAARPSRPSVRPSDRLSGPGRRSAAPRAVRVGKPVLP
jgi:hypothetical protein